MENDVDECLQTVVRDLFGFYKIPDRILLLKQGVQVDRASCFVELVFDFRQGIIRRVSVQQS